MWNFRLLDVQDAALFLTVTFYVFRLAGAISIHSPQRSLTRSVQDDVLFSVDVTCRGIPTIQWTFMSGVVSRSIGTWQPGVYANITEDYVDRVQPYTNGSMGLSLLRLQDAGFYVVTVTETTGNSKDAGFVLKVNEVIYEDLQYLSVSALVLACLVGLGMLAMWLLDKAYRRILAWKQQRANRCRTREQENEATELQPL
ncbi:V-set and transmembrane domain-containing protein 5 [Lampris incognitus]|uniref:V-set and transmembrane domain-containing protein 5 n=1 Tax=Lampris incognitus TaxID=2546036 RepID=UPI0024B5A294|nr:V-set and transmembrane domain-containing protein 5 [Lampris incognitus]